MNLKILINTIPLVSNLTGIGRYTYEISDKLRLCDKFDFNYFYGYKSKKLFLKSDGEKFKPLKHLIDKSIILKKIFRRMILLSSNLYMPNYDLYWEPNFIPLSNIKAKKIITTVHDFSFILHKDYHPKERIDYFENYFFKNIIKSDYIITGSNYSKNEIIDRLDFEKEKIEVIYHGIRHDIFKKLTNLDSRLHLPKKYILSVGSIEPRKNLLGLIKAYDLLDIEYKKEYKLILVGFKGWENNEIMELIDKNKEYIDYLGFISDEELAIVYNLASVFVFPSFYEGFGLPPLEAMACGTPVVSSNSTSLPEVCAEAAIYCNPHDILDIRDKIVTVLDNKDLQNSLVEKGLLRASMFSWEKSAEEHMKLFKKVLK